MAHEEAQRDCDIILGTEREPGEPAAPYFEAASPDGAAWMMDEDIIPAGRPASAAVGERVYSPHWTKGGKCWSQRLVESGSDEAGLTWVRIN